MAHFTATIIDFNGIGNTYQGTYSKDLNGDWCDIQDVSATDSVKASAGVLSKINYYPGGAPGNPIEYYSSETKAALEALANA
jgi:hypothetical protein